MRTRHYYILYTIYYILIISFTCTTTGCGYTTGSLLPPHIKNIYIGNFANKISITGEVSSQQRYKTYRPRLEIDITEAIRDKFIFDGHLRITREENADIVMTGELVDFRREAIQYGYDDSIEKYSIAIIVDMRVKDLKAGKLMWSENGFSGSDDYYTTGSEAKTEDQAVTAAIDDLARRVVERTIEVW